MFKNRNCLERLGRIVKSLLIRDRQTGTIAKRISSTEYFSLVGLQCMFELVLELVSDERADHWGTPRKSCTGFLNIVASHFGCPSHFLAIH